MHKDDFLKLVNNSGIGHWMLSEAASEVFEYTKWMQEIPYINFPNHWQVRIVPPFACAIVRFHVKHPTGGNISVYLDCYGHLGCFGMDDRGKEKPYWEVYPGADGDTSRFAMDDVAGLIEDINRTLEEHK